MKKTHQWIKTIALPTRAHVGGITIDDRTQTLYLSDDSQGVTKLGRIQISKLIKSKKDQILTQFDDVMTLADIKTAATIEYLEYDRLLFEAWYHDSVYPLVLARLDRPSTYWSYD